MVENEKMDSSLQYVEEALKKLTYEQLEQLLCKQAKENLKLKEELLKLEKEID